MIYIIYTHNSHGLDSVIRYLYRYLLIITLLVNIDIKRLIKCVRFKNAIFTYICTYIYYHRKLHQKSKCRFLCMMHCNFNSEYRKISHYAIHVFTTPCETWFLEAPTRPEVRSPVARPQNFFFTGPTIIIRSGHAKITFIYFFFFCSSPKIQTQKFYFPLQNNVKTFFYFLWK